MFRQLLQMLLYPLKRLVLYRTKQRVDFSFGWFSFYVAITTVGWLVLIGYLCIWLSPTLYTVQRSAPWYSYAICFTVAHMVMALFEFLFHRYILHSVFWQKLGFLKKKHTRHHALTHVVQLKNEPGIDDRIPVRNIYAIDEPEQIESSAFPAYALVSFWGIFNLLLLPTQIWLFPNQPLLITGNLAVTFSFWLYEVKHAVEHLNYEKYWQRWVERDDWIGRIAKKVYGFHLLHHEEIRVNQAIGGVFGFPLWDIVFRTCFIPKELPLPGAKVTPESQVPPAPCRFIIWLDRVVDSCETTIRERSKAHALKAHVKP